MINVILTYNQTKEFTKEAQSGINKIQFSKIPEMRVLDVVEDEEIVSKIIPYQANVKDLEEFELLKASLELFGVVVIVGIWREDGSKIELDINKYRNALNDVQVFEKVEVKGMVEDEEGEEIEVILKTYIGLKSSKRPTLTQAKNIQVNVFNNKFVRQLV